MIKMPPLFPLFVFFFLTTHSVLPISAQEKLPHPKIPPFPCGNNNGKNPECGELKLKCSENNPMIQLKRKGHWFSIQNISQSQPDSTTSIVIMEKVAPRDFLNPCKLIDEYSLPTLNDSSQVSPYNITAENSSTLYKCSHDNHEFPPKDFTPLICKEHEFYCKPPNTKSFPFEQQCENITLPFSLPPLPYNPTPLLHQDHPEPQLFIKFTLHISSVCFGSDKVETNCHSIPQIPHQFPSLTSQGQENKTKTMLGLIVGLGLVFVGLFAIMGLAMMRWGKKQKGVDSRKIVDSYVNMEDQEIGGHYLGVRVFSYEELSEATNNFDAQRELGDGGSATVYYGILKDGKEVAIKRLYEHNYDRVLSQFMNEVQICSHLRHKNLVSLYGCTSRSSRELLLVYEYIPNGTVADHLYGNHAKTSPLTWPTRLSIAIQTASALACLHATDVLHCNVNTTNILLNNNFNAKLSGFSLLRQFVTNVLPDVDLEYGPRMIKSDVYSFGVVLLELLSSIRQEISPSNLAVNKIKKGNYSELIDQGLGFASDTKVRIMMVEVAELACDCLHQDKEMRPKMGEVLERLMRIKDGKIETRVIDGNWLSMNGVAQPLPPPPPPLCSSDCDEVSLFKKTKHEQTSLPDAVTKKYSS